MREMIPEDIGMIFLYDVIAVTIKTGERRILETAKTFPNAKAIVNFAVCRRGVETEYYTIEPHRFLHVLVR